MSDDEADRTGDSGPSDKTTSAKEKEMVKEIVREVLLGLRTDPSIRKDASSSSKDTSKGKYRWTSSMPWGYIQIEA